MPFPVIPIARTAAPYRIPKSGAGGKIDAGFIPDLNPFTRIDVGAEASVGISLVNLFNFAGSNLLELHTANATGLKGYGHSNIGFRAFALDFFRSGGTYDAPTVVTSGMTLGYTSFGGYDGSAWQSPAVQWQAYASENWSGSARGASLDFSVTANGGTTITSRLRLNHDGSMSFNGRYIKPYSDTTTAIQIANAAGTPFVTFDSTNLRMSALAIENTPIGGTTPAGAVFTTLSASSGSIVTLANASGTQDVDVLALFHNKTGAGNDVSGLSFDLNNSAASRIAYGRISLVNTGVTAGAEDGTFIHSVRKAGALVEFMRLRGGQGVIFNELGNDQDFRVEGDTDANAFVLDASSNRVGLGIAVPLRRLHVNDDGILIGSAESGTDYIRLLASNGSGEPEITLFNTGAVDARFSSGNLTRTTSTGMKVNVTFESAGGLLAASGIMSTAASAALGAVGSLILRSANATAPYIRMTEVGAAVRGAIGFAAGSASMLFELGGNETGLGSGTAILTLSTSAITVSNAINIVLSTTTGTRIGTATSQKLSLWNATPDVQPTTAIAAATFVANTSGIVNDTATFGGYTIGQIVAALKRLGALA